MTSPHVARAWAAACLIAIGGTLAAQNPPRDARTTTPKMPPAPAGTASLSGIVTTEDGAQPIRFAAVVLLGATTGVVKVTSTDADGRFAFTALPADRFTVGASKTPYLGAVAGARRPARPGTPIVVANGQKIGDVAIRLPMGAAISGTITDERGQPSSQSPVTLQQWRMQGDERTLVGVGITVTTDDRGRYRIFGLTPGEYVVAAFKSGLPAAPRPLSVAEVDAALQGSPMPPSPGPPAPPVRYAPSYFPGTTRVSDAVPITLTSGEDRGGVDIRIESVPVSRLEGVLVAADGQPIGGGMVLMIGTGVLGTAMTTRTAPDGRFTAPNLLPGQYALMATGQGPHAGHFAHAAVEMSGADLQGLQLTMRPSFTMTGRIAFQARGTAPALAGRRPTIRMVGSAGTGRPAPNASATDERGAFSVGNMTPGRYMFGGPLVSGPSAETISWSLASAVLDGVDVTDRVVDIVPDAPPKQVMLTYTDRFQELTGRLQSQSGAPASDYTIVVFPEDRAYWTPGTRRIATARPGTDGRFTLSGPGPTTLPPGRYLLAAVTDLGRDEQFDPAFLAQLVPAGIPISLGPGEKKTQDLAIK
jgi:hypothetical protein